MCIRDRGNPAYPQGYKIERVDTIAITHGHFDHIHDAVPLAKEFSPAVVGIFETCHWLESQGVSNTRPMNKGGSQQAADRVRQHGKQKAGDSPDVQRVWKVGHDSRKHKCFFQPMLQQKRQNTGHAQRQRHCILIRRYGGHSQHI